MEREDATYEGGNGWKGVYFPPELAVSSVIAESTFS